MMRFISILAVMAVVCASSAFSVAAQTTPGKQVQTESVRNKVRQLGLGERVKVTATLYDGTKYKGWVREASDNDFVVVDKQGSPHVIRYVDVSSVKASRGLSTGAKIAIGAAIGAGAVLAVLGIIIASDN